MKLLKPLPQYGITGVVYRSLDPHASAATVQFMVVLPYLPGKVLLQLLTVATMEQRVGTHSMQCSLQERTCMSAVTARWSCGPVSCVAHCDRRSGRCHPTCQPLASHLGAVVALHTYYLCCRLRTRYYCCLYQQTRTHHAQGCVFGALYTA